MIDNNHIERPTRDKPGQRSADMGSIPNVDKPGPVTTAINGGTILPKRPVGYVEVVPGFNVSVYRWPNWLHRTMTRWLLGWKWERTR